MGTQEILNKVPLSLAEVKGKISAIKKRDKELNFRSNKVNEYLTTYHIISQKDAKALYGKLEKLEIPRIKNVQIKKIIDLLPASLEDLKIILSGYNITINSDSQKKIVETVKSYLPKKK